MKNYLSFIKSNLIYLIAIFTIIFAVVVFATGLMIPRKPPAQEKPISVFNPSPTPFIQDRPIPGKNYQNITESDQEQLRKDALVSQLIKILPYKGIYFSLDYDYSTNQFFYTLTPDHKIEGNQELDGYLQTKQISDRSWLKNLVLKSN